jgi:hypothetical protein
MAFNFYGTGTGFVGRLEEQPDGSYKTTEWVMIFFIPLIPLKSVVVVSEAEHLDGVPLVYAKRQMLVQTRPLDWPHIRRIYMGVTPLVAGIIALVVWAKK